MSGDERRTGTVQALLWDVDGTLAETERDGHRVAFNRAFEECGLPWRWDEGYYGELLLVAGGRERLLHDLARRVDAPAEGEARTALVSRLHARKNAIYAALVSDGRIPLRPGVRDLMEECRVRGTPMGIATTTSRANVDALLGAHFGAEWEAWFGTVVCGEDVARKKPDPAAYVLAVHALGVDPRRAVALEDSPAGVTSARGAGVAVVVTSSAYFADASFDGASAIGPGLDSRAGWQPAARGHAPPGGGIGLDDLASWCFQGDAGISAP
jgi:HAD superfamily hydrolase (TIGR01509 family)